MSDPKETTMAREAADEKARVLAARTYTMSAEDWEEADADEFGGKSEILLIEENEVVGPFVYIGSQQMTTSLGEATVHTATDKEGNSVRLPIQATFVRAVDQAALHRGDTFLVKRYEDTLKKQGKGKGKPMAIYAIKVTKRSELPPTAAAV